MHSQFSTKKIGKDKDVFSKILTKIQASPHLYRKAVRTLELLEQILKIQLKIRNKQAKKEKRETQENILASKKIESEVIVAVEISAITGEEKQHGIGKYVSNVILELLKFEIQFVFFTITKDQKVQEHIIDKNLKILLNTNTYTDILAFKNNKSFSSILWTSPFEENILDLIPFECKTFVIVYDLIPLFRPFDFHSITKRKIYINKISQLKHVNCLPISNHTRNEILKFGISQNLSRPLGAGNLKTIRLSNQKYEDKFFLVHGGAHPRKNLDFVVKNWDADYFSRSHRLKITNNIPLESQQRLLRLVRNRPDFIEFIGYVDDDQLVDMYEQAELIICPSLDEGFGLPVLDALKYGKRIIASDIPSHREIILYSELFFNPKKSSDFIRSIHYAFQTEQGDLLKALLKTTSWSNASQIIFDSIRI